MTTTKSSLYGHDVAGGLRSRDVQIDENVNFTSLLLPESILKGLHSTGFKRPSPIQLAAIPLGRCGLDMIVQAKSGTGKTLVFTVIALELLDMDVKRTQVIIVAPTREIAVQIADVIETVGQHVQGLKVGTLIGGTRVETSRAQLRKYQIIVGAPGRIRHLIENSVFDSKAVRLFVLDEADKLMEDTFVKDVNYIFHSLAESKQIMACSATYTPDLVDFVKKYMKDGLHITPNGGFCPVLLGLRQFVYLTGDHINPFTRLVRKQQALFRLISTVRFDQCLIFCNYVVRAESLCGILQKQGWGVTSLTSKQTQEDRLKALTDLKENKARILVTTDLAARGIDASAVNLVINMDVPISPEVYLHRIGRAGRFGNKGLCVTIVSKGEDQTNFQRLIGKIPACEMSVSVIPEEETADLWQEGEYEVLKGIEPVENNDLVEEEGEQDNDEKIDSVVEAKILPALVEDESIVGKSIEESMATEVEDGEIVEDDDVNGDDKKRQSADESSSSGVDLSSPSSKTGSPPSGGDPPKYVDWKNRYDVDHVVDHLSNLSLRHSTSPWRLGHENLWRGNGPQSCFPFQSHRRLYHNYRYHGYYNPQEYYDEPTSRYDASRRNPNTWSRNNYWMHALTSQIDNYVHYARRFHS